MTTGITALKSILRNRLVAAGIPDLKAAMRDLELCMRSCSSSDDPAVFSTHCRKCRRDARELAALRAIEARNA